MHCILWDEFTHIVLHLASFLLHYEIQPDEHCLNPSPATYQLYVFDQVTEFFLPQFPHQ